MIVYIVTFIAVYMLSAYASSCEKHLDKKNRIQYNTSGKIAIFICALILIFVSGFRYYVGTDYGEYFYNYADKRDNWLLALQNFNEPGLNILAKIGSWFYDSPVVLFILAAIITIWLCVSTIRKYSSDFCFSMLLFILLGCYQGSFNGIRQYLAMSILFAGHQFIANKKLWKYIFIVFLAFCFHKSAIIMFPVYFVAQSRLSLKTVFIVIVSAILIRFSYDSLLSGFSFLRGEEKDYDFSYFYSAVNPLRVFVTFAPLVVTLFGKKANHFQKYKDKFQFYLMFSVINAGLSFATIQSTYLARATIYTEVYATLMYPELIGSFYERDKRILKVVILILFLIYWLYSIYATDLIPFRWVFGNV